MIAGLVCASRGRGEGVSDQQSSVISQQSAVSSQQSAVSSQQSSFIDHRSSVISHHSSIITYAFKRCSTLTHSLIHPFTHSPIRLTHSPIKNTHLQYTRHLITSMINIIYDLCISNEQSSHQDLRHIPPTTIAPLIHLLYPSVKSMRLLQQVG